MVVAMAQASPSLTRLVDKFNTAHEILKKARYSLYLIYSNNVKLPVLNKVEISMAMADIQAVQRIIAYEFRRTDLLALALTAAGADENNHDGNRRLGQLGGFVLQLVVGDKAFVEGASRCKCHDQRLILALTKPQAKQATVWLRSSTKIVEPIWQNRLDCIVLSSTARSSQDIHH